MNKKDKLILVINPGSTSTKLALYNGTHENIRVNITHDEERITRPEDLKTQLPNRIKIVRNFLKEQNVQVENLDAIVSRSGELKPMPSGAYAINEPMIEDMLSCKYGLHPCNLGAAIAHELKGDNKAITLVVDAPTSDEFKPLARISGIPGIPRRSCLHVLNQKSIAKRLAKDLGKDYNSLNLIGIHMGGGITIAAHEKGQIIDANNGLDGDGPYSPQRAGTIPAADLVELCFSGNYSHEEVYGLLTTNGGLMGYLGSQDGEEVEKRMLNGDKEAALIYEGMAYQTAKEIGSMATVLKGKIDGIFFTGGLSHSKILIDWLKERVDFLGPVYVYPGEDELKTLAEATAAVLEGSQELFTYGPEER